MRVNIADLKLDAGSHKTVPLEVSLDPEVLGGTAVAFEHPFTGEAEIWNAGDRFLVKAMLQGEATVECSRCLAPASLPVRLSFEEEFVEGDPDDLPDEEDEDARAVSGYTGDEIDLGEAVRDNVLLELPMKPLCSPNCKGLCPGCGANLNEGPCLCHADKPVDPRLQALKELLEKPDQNS